MIVMSNEPLFTLSLKRIKDLSDQHEDGIEQSSWACYATGFFDFHEFYQDMNAALAVNKSRLVEDESVVDEGWRLGFEEKIGDELVFRELVDQIRGTHVYEAMPMGKNGPLNHLSKVFLVLQRGVQNTLHSCDNAAVAATVAQKIAAGQTLEPLEGVRLISSSTDPKDAATPQTSGKGSRPS